MLKLTNLLILILMMSICFTATASRYKNYDSSPAFSTYINPPGKKLIIVDPKKHMWAAYTSDGQLLRWGNASAGKDYCPDLRRGCHTVTGTFAIYNKGGANCISHKFPLETHGGARTPYCMHFHGGYAIHGSNEVIPGRNLSHGCVRVHPQDARWLNQEFANIGTRVIVRPYYYKNT